MSLNHVMLLANHVTYTDLIRARYELHMMLKIVI
jgi:hypothetical protein